MSLVERLAEFNANVWDHSADEFQASFDARRRLDTQEIKALTEIVQAIGRGEGDSRISELVQGQLAGDPDFMAVLLQIVGLTRNKILQDLKAHARANRLSLKLSNYLTLSKDQPTWAVAGPYLSKRLRVVLSHIAECSDLEDPLQSLNQATWLPYIRMERAKRQGHEAEHRMATVFSSCKIPFEPKEKADNPLCRDAIVHEVSFDIVVPNARAPQLCVKATVHTANIGQYGESKDHLEMDRARSMLESEFAEAVRPILLAFIDGVGFESNQAGLKGVLDKSDEFCQFRTLWKSVIICAHVIDLTLKVHLPESAIDTHGAFLARYGFADRVLPMSVEAGADAIPAGEALIEV